MTDKTLRGLVIKAEEEGKDYIEVDHIKEDFNKKGGYVYGKRIVYKNKST